MYFLFFAEYFDSITLLYHGEFCSGVASGTSFGSICIPTICMLMEIGVLANARLSRIGSGRLSKGRTDAAATS